MKKVIAVASCLLFFGSVTYLYGILTAIIQRRQDNEYLFRRQSQFIYHLASMGEYGLIRELRLADPGGFKELERVHGKIRSWSIERVLVKELGLPGYVLVRVERNSRQKEVLSYMSRGAFANVEVINEVQQRAIFGDMPQE